MIIRDGQGPIHLSASWGLVKLMLNLIEENVDVNAKVSLEHSLNSVMCCYEILLN